MIFRFLVDTDTKSIPFIDKRIFLGIIGLTVFEFLTYG
jgi:hypothetical protein